ncbi:hypothetical protein [Pseudoxanthomonas sp. PXM01]|uniref:hypothetical protein n=1 Tax=Pseudoxanthomonas sp. PXM01 TaxID=2769295 RepID=UPI001780474B|nr:hypothetical protein [Pseudoxanthomonas sp. PXM01]MBD9471243.1 hypothetical protein [Pseudoxanthomonas sp. PXM01]
MPDVLRQRLFNVGSEFIGTKNPNGLNVAIIHPINYPHKMVPLLTLSVVARAISSSVRTDDRKARSGVPGFIHESSCKEELERFKQQNVEWLQRLLLRHKQDLRLPTGMQEGELAQIIFASLEGMMLVSLLQPEPAGVFQRMVGGWFSTIVPSGFTLDL